METVEVAPPKKGEVRVKVGITTIYTNDGITLDRLGGRALVLLDFNLRSRGWGICGRVGTMTQPILFLREYGVDCFGS